MSAAPELVGVVDDDQSVRRGLRRLFKSAGYAAETLPRRKTTWPANFSKARPA